MTGASETRFRLRMQPRPFLQVELDAGSDEGAAEGADELFVQIFEGEFDIVEIRLDREGDRLGQLHDIIVPELLLDHGLVSLEGGQHGPETFDGRVLRLE